MRFQQLARAILVWLCGCFALLEAGASPALLGADPTRAIEELGSPAEVFVAESELVPLETVVFFYEDFRYLYFHGNRVWQIRHDERSEHNVVGIELGADRRDVIATLGPPRIQDDESAVFELADRGFPVRLRAFFDNDTLVDVYIFRADY